MMKKLLIFAMTLLFGISATKGQTRSIRAHQDTRAEQELRKLEREWLDADAAAVERIEADDFTITYGDGSVRDKAQYVEMARRRGVKDPNVSQWTEDSKVRIYGDTAVTTGRYLYKNKDTISESRYTDTYIKGKGRWQVVASHLSNIGNVSPSTAADDSNVRPPVTEADLRIVQRARGILDSPTKWNRADNRECPAQARTFSLYCALERATIEIGGKFEHRGAALQEARFVIDEIAANRNYNHRLMDYNNDPATTFADIREVLKIVEDLIALRLRTGGSRAERNRVHKLVSARLRFGLLVRLKLKLHAAKAGGLHGFSHSG
jgi:hypothetical protein